MTEANGRPRVLVVDDEPSNLDTFRRVFRRDFEIELAGSVPEAVALATQRPFDVALVDYAMPGATGIEFLRRAAALRPEMVCLLMTAHADLDEVKAAYAAGLARGILMKPWDRETVLRWVGNALRLSSLKRTVGELRSALVTPKKPG